MGLWRTNASTSGIVKQYNVYALCGNSESQPESGFEMHPHEDISSTL